MKSEITYFAIAVLALATLSFRAQTLSAADPWEQASRNAKQSQEAFLRAERNTAAWLDSIDEATSLLPDNFNTTIYTPENYAADNYPFMICTSYFTALDRLTGILKRQLQQEMKLTTQPNGLPTWFDLATGKKAPAKRSDIFSGSEYVKDGLIAISELIGESPWYDRMVNLIDAILVNAATPSRRGAIPDTGSEVNGEMLQTLTRMYWKTREIKYLEMAVRIGDAYILDQFPETGDVPVHFWNFQTNTGESTLRLRDHGTEIIGGLALLYCTLARLDPEKARQYESPLRRMFNAVARIGFNEDGMMYNVVNVKTGKVPNTALTDNWGYNYMAWLDFAMATGDTSYEQPVRHALSNIHKYRNYRWEPRANDGQSADGYADSIEGALNLLNRIPVASAFEWVETEIRRLYAFQQETGIVEGWHGDGNFSRTILMYGLYKTQGVRLAPWNKHVRWGAVREGDSLYLTISSDIDWSGTVHFDYPRHAAMWNLPQNWPRLNEFPEWYTMDRMRWYRITDDAGTTLREELGTHMIEGLTVSVTAGTTLRWLIMTAE